MKCPICPDQTLTMTERSGVEIDFCPSCRGVWLDRGELDKIIERSESMNTPSRRDDHSREQRSDRSFGDRYRDDDRRAMPKKRKRESFLGDLFEF